MGGKLTLRTKSAEDHCDYKKAEKRRRAEQCQKQHPSAPADPVQWRLRIYHHLGVRSDV